MRHKKLVHLSAEKHIEEPCAITYVYFSNGLGIYISSALVLEGKVHQAACEVLAKIYAKKAIALCSLWTTDWINAKFNCYTIHINMGQHVLKMLRLV